MWLFTTVWGNLVLFMVSNGLIGAGVMGIAKGKPSPVLATFLLLLGITVMLQFGLPGLFTDLRNCGFDLTCKV